MKQILIVGLGGFIGAVSRFKLGGLILHHTTNWKMPVSTVVVNVLGCLVAGILVGLAEKHDYFSPEARLLLFTGILGGFTTFSAFGVETIYLIQRHQLGYASLNILLSVFLGLLALWIGTAIIR